jgi:hypothetical protein
MTPMNNELWFLMKIYFFYEDIGFLTESQEMEGIARCECFKLFQGRIFL